MAFSAIFPIVLSNEIARYDLGAVDEMLLSRGFVKTLDIMISRCILRCPIILHEKTIHKFCKYVETIFLLECFLVYLHVFFSICLLCCWLVMWVGPVVATTYLSFSAAMKYTHSTLSSLAPISNNFKYQIPLLVCFR